VASRIGKLKGEGRPITELNSLGGDAIEGAARGDMSQKVQDVGNIIARGGQGERGQ